MVYASYTVFAMPKLRSLNTESNKNADILHANTDKNEITPPNMQHNAPIVPQTLYGLCGQLDYSMTFSCRPKVVHVPDPR